MDKWKMLKLKSGRYVVYKSYIPANQSKIFESREVALEARNRLNQELKATQSEVKG